MTEFGYLLPTFDVGDMVELGVLAEQAGFDSVWVPDSPFMYGLPDPVTLLAGLATATRRVTLATGVLLAAMHQPVLLAHRLATLDQLSGGRLIVGLGYGFDSPDTERQFAAAGVPFAGRIGRLTETVAVLRALWSGKPVSHAGTHFAFDEMTLAPAPTAPPPIWLAGAGASAERRAGRLADGWLPYLPTPELYADGLRRVREEGREVTPALYVTVALDPSVDTAQERLRTTVERWYGRPFDVISTRQATFGGTPAGLREFLAPYLAAGVRHVVLRVAAEEPRRGLDTISQSISAL
ncbi:LLM class flavin-dependent oxidoreductase [Actinophytocola oryzae]|uniref:Putative F420-dependent oxidoreductase n=1 Tax=Actinophytocola oryzae TaxID=502181 RepID=A0A4V3FTP6_9PSEU|nr:LLM class flavin-dependent oxidoreductase [Actinophytocola oryzae]TDV52201.1 putative F420-dependent oxidoreductase [Actinophytocola oryzae]